MACLLKLLLTSGDSIFLKFSRNMLIFTWLRPISSKNEWIWSSSQDIDPQVSILLKMASERRAGSSSRPNGSLNPIRDKDSDVCLSNSSSLSFFWQAVVEKLEIYEYNKFFVWSQLLSDVDSYCCGLKKSCCWPSAHSLSWLLSAFKSQFWLGFWNGFWTRAELNLCIWVGLIEFDSSELEHDSPSLDRVLKT